MTKDDDAADAPSTQRLDKWLWFARVAKSRSASAALVSEGKIRVNRVKVDRPAHAVRIGDVITSTAQRNVRVLKIAGLGQRREGAPEARLLFEDLSPPVERKECHLAAAAMSGHREAGSGRPTKKQRRETIRLKEGWE